MPRYNYKRYSLINQGPQYVEVNTRIAWASVGGMSALLLSTEGWGIAPLGKTHDHSISILTLSSQLISLSRTYTLTLTGPACPCSAPAEGKEGKLCKKENSAQPA